MLILMYGGVVGGWVGGGGECKFLNGNAAAFLIWFQLQSGD